MSMLSIVLITLNDNKLGSSTLLGKKNTFKVSIIFVGPKDLGTPT